VVVAGPIPRFAEFPPIGVSISRHLAADRGTPAHLFTTITRWSPTICNTDAMDPAKPGPALRPRLPPSATESAGVVSRQEEEQGERCRPPGHRTGYRLSSLPCALNQSSVVAKPWSRLIGL
jgi:hypothetical protein